MIDDKPNWNVFSLRDLEDGSYETEIVGPVGEAFWYSDGSIDVYLDAVPLNGKLHILAPKPRGD